MAAGANSRPTTDTRRAVPAEDDIPASAVGLTVTLAGTVRPPGELAAVARAAGYAEAPGDATLCQMSLDPAASNPDHYKVVFENERVRVLEYSDQPGDSTTPHEHPDSVMYTLTSFRRRLVSGDAEREVELRGGTVGWLPAQQHHGENIGETPTHVIFVELKESRPDQPSAAAEVIGPQSV